MQENPYAAPKAAVRDAAEAGAPAGLWNPNAAANWSLVFTPAFGAYLHMLNWRALGEPGRAAASKGWFVAGLCLLALYMVIGAFAPDARVADGTARGVGFAFLIVWYFASARGQARYVKERWGDDYPRRGWTRPLLIGVGLYAGYFATAFLIGVLLGLARNFLR